MRYLEEFQDDCAELIKQIKNYETLNNKKIFITGACGMIGSAIVDILMFLNRKKSFNISVLAGARDVEKFRKRFEVYEGDERLKYVKYEAILPIEIENDCDYIIHAAGNSSPELYTTKPVEVMQCNIIGMNNVLAFAKKNKTKRVLYLSSSEVYGKKSEISSFLENDYGFIDILNSRMSYPSSKRATETLCISYSKEYGMNVVIVRPGHIYGPTALKSDSKASSQFAILAKMKKDIVLKSAGNQVRSYCYVYDCASAIITTLINGKSCEAYNISNKASICSIRQLAETFSYFAGTKIIFENPTDREKMAFNPMDNSSLNAKKLEMLGWSGIFSLQEGVRKTLLYM